MGRRTFFISLLVFSAGIAIGLWFPPGGKPARSERKSTLRSAIPTMPETAGRLSARQILGASGGRITISESERDMLKLIDWADREPEAALRWADEFPDYDLRLEHLENLLIHLAQTQPQRALQAALKVGILSERPEWYELADFFFREWAKSDVRAAADHLVGLIAGQSEIRNVEYRLTGETIASQFSADDPAGRFWFAYRLVEGDDERIFSMMENAEISDLGWIDVLPSELAKATARQLVVHKAAAEIAIAVLEQIPEGDRPGAALTIARRLDDPQAILDLFESQGVGNRAAGFLANSNPPDAQVEIWKNLPSEEAQAEGASHIVTNWLRQDPEGATTWVTNLAAGVPREAAVGSLVRGTVAGDFELGFAWADNLTDPSLRERYLRVALRHWSVQQPDTAAAAIEAADLSPAATASLLSRLPKP